MLIEKFVDSVSDEKPSWKDDIGFIVMIVLIKLFLIYIVMVLWPRVMPKIMPSINKNPGYLNLIGLSVILSLL